MEVIEKCEGSKIKKKKKLSGINGFEHRIGGVRAVKKKELNIPTEQQSYE